MQFLKLTEAEKLNLEFPVILCKPQPELQAISLQPKISWLCVHWCEWMSPNRTLCLSLTGISLLLMPLACKQGQMQCMCLPFCNRLFKHSLNWILFITISRKTITRWLLITASTDWGSRPYCPGQTHTRACTHTYTHAHTTTACHKELTI